MAADPGIAGRVRETYQQSAPAESRVFARLAEQMLLVQHKNRQYASRLGVDRRTGRAFHEKATLTVRAVLRFNPEPELAPGLRVGFAQPDREYQAVVRFSNASGLIGPDRRRDLRGVAIRVFVEPEGVSHDLLMTNFPVSHARDATQFVQFARATAGGPLAKLPGAITLAFRAGLLETIRMYRIALKGAGRRVDSIATERYFSRGAIRWGADNAVRYSLVPLPAGQPAGRPDPKDPDYLRHEAERRLAAGPIRFTLQVQPFQDYLRTPIEDASIPWLESDSVPIPVATLTIAQQIPENMEPVDFNPWNTTEDFQPLGNINRARKTAYDASAAYRHDLRWPLPVPPRNIVFGGLARWAFGILNRRVSWDRLPARLSLMNLQAIRLTLFSRNLIDTAPEAPPAARPAPPTPPDEASRVARTADGTDNDRSAKDMGAVGAAFGRNMPPDGGRFPDAEPNPILVSDELLRREYFRPATSLNILAAAWIQFQVHDWVHHRLAPLGVNDITVRFPGGVPGDWRNRAGAQEQVDPDMRIAGDDPAGVRNRLGVHANTTTFWADGSELYGSDRARQQNLRVVLDGGVRGAKLQVGADGALLRRDGQVLTGFAESWWLGLSVMHTLFALEHNLLCDELLQQHPDWSQDRVFNTARLIVAALIAKIQTLEWTPTALATETLRLGMNANWNGPAPRDRLTRFGAWLIDAHAGVGIPKTDPYHYGVPFSLTEEFVTVYRMHPLIPDRYEFYAYPSGTHLGTRELADILDTKGEDVMAQFELANVVYSLAIANPGAITLHNFPEGLRRYTRNGQENVGEIVDLAVADLVRTRNRRIPRYNDFRANLHMPRITRWEDLCQDEMSLRRLQRVYSSLDEVDTMVGMFAETPPEGFAFSDTAFRIFVMTATRRIQSDRFLTRDFRPGIYTDFGMDWVRDTKMADIIRRHCPALATVIPRDDVFAPWTRAGRR